MAAEIPVSQDGYFLVALCPFRNIKAELTGTNHAEWKLIEGWWSGAVVPAQLVNDAFVSRGGLGNDDLFYIQDIHQHLVGMTHTQQVASGGPDIREEVHRKDVIVVFPQLKRDDAHPAWI